jgi:hypothetical protein
MKQDSTGFDVERNGNFNSSKFGIKSASDMVHIFSVLRSKLYSDKVLAVCREYATNACDAHIDAGIPDQPIRITLPNHNDLFFRVRDFGKGLDEEGIREVYCMYGASTKRNSNAFNGQMGFGSKSAFAYTDFWQINSHCGGTKVSYSVFLDESGLGEVSELSREPTDETGIEIVIPVDSSDVGDFHNRARDLYRWFRVKPDIIGAQVSIEQPAISIDLGDVKITKDRQSDPTAIMGNVGYPVDIAKMLYGQWDTKGNANRLNQQDSEWLRWRCSNLVMHFEIGELQMAASREALEYKDSTVKAIIKKLTGIRDRANAKVNAAVLAETNLRAALRKANELQYISNSGIDSIVSADKITWQGKTWESRPCIDDHCFASVVEVYRSGSRLAARPMDVLSKERINPLGNMIVMLDTERAVGIARAKHLAAQSRSGVTILVPAPTQVDGAKNWLLNNVNEDLFVFASQCEDPEIADSSEDDDKPLVRPRRPPTRVDAAKRAAIYLTPVRNAFERSAKSKNWSPAEFDTNNTNLIIQIESFTPKGFGENPEPRNLAADFDHLVTAGVLPANSRLLGVRTADLEKAKEDGCLLLADVLREAGVALQEQAGLYDAINMSAEQKRIMILAKKAGAQMFFDPETTEGSAASKKLSTLLSSRLGRSLGLGRGEYLSTAPKQTYAACLEVFPMLRLVNAWELTRNAANEAMVLGYMKVVMGSLSNSGK